MQTIADKRIIIYFLSLVNTLYVFRSKLCGINLVIWKIEWTCHSINSTPSITVAVAAAAAAAADNRLPAQQEALASDGLYVTSICPTIFAANPRRTNHVTGTL